MTASKTPELWNLPAAALQASLAEMAPDGVRGCEGIALWLGRRSGATAEITHVVALRGLGIEKLPDRLSISPELLNEVTDVAIDLEATRVKIPVDRVVGVVRGLERVALLQRERMKQESDRDRTTRAVQHPLAELLTTSRRRRRRWR